MLPIVYFRHKFASKLYQVSPIGLLPHTIGIITLAAILATAGTHGRIERYSFDYSKADISHYLAKFLARYPQYQLPDSLAFSNKSEGKILSQNDTVHFNLYLANSKVGKIYWATFMARTKDWNKPHCNFDLIGIRLNNGTTLIDKDLSKKDREYVKKIFYEEIIQKLNLILKKNNP